MKALSTIAIIIGLAATLGGCASQNGYTTEREYRNPFLRARHIAAPQRLQHEEVQPCTAQNSQ